MRQTERQADGRDRQHADQRAADNAPVIERQDQHEADQHQDRHGVLQIAERDQRLRLRHHHLGLFQRDDAEKQADAGRGRQLQVVRNRVDHVLADAEHRDQKEQHARTEHRRQRLLPGVFVGQHHGEGEEGVDAHAGRQRDRIIGVKRHHHGAHRRRHAGGDEHRARVHARLAEDRRIDEHDIDHGQERGQTGDEFGLDIGALLLEPEVLIKHGYNLRLVALRRRCFRLCPRPCLLGALDHTTPRLAARAATLSRLIHARQTRLWMMWIPARAGGRFELAQGLERTAPRQEFEVRIMMVFTGRPAGVRR